MLGFPLLRTARRTVALASVALLCLTGTAFAAHHARGAVTPTVTLHVHDLFIVRHDAVTVPGRAVTVVGYTRPFVARERVQLKAFVGDHRFRTAYLRLRPLQHGRVGVFGAILRAPAAGQVSLVVTHGANARMRGFERRAGFDALAENASFGSTGPFVQLIQQQLSRLHFYLPLSGVYDAHTGLAIDAYHRLLGQGVAQTLNAGTINELLDGRGSFHIRYPGQGRHAEGDLSDQLLALISGNKVYWILPISSGKPSTPTVLGSWQIYRRTPGYLPDGMYYSDFFTGGYAIHGYNPAPDYPASHGCMRLPIMDAIPVFNWLALGDWVDTYYT